MMKLPFLYVLILLTSCGISCRALPPPNAPEPADRILIVKSAHTMTLLKGGRTLRTYPVALARGPNLPKERAGDHRTPEGMYNVAARNDRSKFYLALRLSYPNAKDVQRALQAGVDPGGLVEIHGLPNGLGWIGGFHRHYDWTDGCIAVTDNEMKEIWQMVPVGTVVEIRH
jgi:murein L,D-transpeptidase YafK